MLLHLLQFLLHPAFFPCRLVRKELVNLLLCLFDNGIQTCSLQLFDTSGNCSCRIRCTGQQVILVLIPNSVAVCDLVLNIGYIQSKAQAGRRYSRFVLLFYLIPCIRIAIRLSRQDEEDACV